mmetsp:Transcript_5395/g.14481  ORF Transcript_5395/g.14481 Transcript_5395/m.14481 type:complete len:212 (-) Transcript_5395:201-836(-)
MTTRARSLHARNASPSLVSYSTRTTLLRCVDDFCSSSEIWVTRAPSRSLTAPRRCGRKHSRSSASTNAPVPAAKRICSPDLRCSLLTRRTSCIEYSYRSQKHTSSVEFAPVSLVLRTTSASSTSTTPISRASAVRRRFCSGQSHAAPKSAPCRVSTRPPILPRASKTSTRSPPGRFPTSRHATRPLRPAPIITASHIAAQMRLEGRECARA